jgi:hypothetical protein
MANKFVGLLLVVLTLNSWLINNIAVESFPKNPHKLPGRHRVKAGVVVGPPGLSNALFHNLRCKGTYDVFALALAERVCDDCYDLYQEIDLMAYCRSVNGL